LEPTLLHKHIEQGRLLVARLEKLSPDSRWARRASGARGNLLKLLDELQEQMDQGQAVTPPDVQRLESLTKFGFFMLEKAAQEIVAG
jgi:hypothetical protein